MKRKRKKRISRAGKGSMQTRRCDILLREVVIQRDKKCLRCGKLTSLQASHILPKGRYPAMRYELKNVIALCNACHIFWWHRNPVEAGEWVIKTFTQAYIDELRNMAAFRRRTDKKAIEVYFNMLLNRYPGVS